MVFFLLLSVAFVFAQDRAPATGPFSNEKRVGLHLPSDFEPSGCVYHPRLRELFVAHDKSAIGRVSELDDSTIAVYTLEVKLSNGTTQRFDTEGMTVLNPAGQTVWAINEFPPQVVEFDFMNNIKARSFALNPNDFDPPVNRSFGLEAVTFLPVEVGQDNLFLLGHSLTGDVYKFKIPEVSSNPAQYLGKFSTFAGQMSDMDYHVATKTLYIIFGHQSPGLLKAFTINANGPATEIGSWTLPGYNQQGFCINPEETVIGSTDCSVDVYICEDWGPSNRSGVYRYDFKHTCPPNAVLKPSATTKYVAPAANTTAATTKAGCASGSTATGCPCGMSGSRVKIYDRCKICDGKNACVTGTAATSSIFALTALFISLLAVFL